MEQGSVERSGIDRLADVVVHARSQALLSILDKGVGGHRQDGRVFPARQGADSPGGLQSVHDRHLYIHQDQVVGSDACLGDGFLAVCRRVHTEVHSMEQFQCDLPVDRVIFRQQYLGAGRAPAECGLGVCRAGVRCGGENAIPSLQPGGKPEGAAYAGLALDPGFTIHQPGQPLGDG